VNPVIYFALIAVTFIVLIYLPTRSRNRQMQQVQAIQASLDVGAEVMTSSGLYGRVVALREDEVDLEVAPGVVTTWTRLAVREVKSPAHTALGEPAADDKPGPDVD
jgi:preprotein translocase subunit YajC